MIGAVHFKSIYHQSCWMGANLGGLVLVALLVNNVCEVCLKQKSWYERNLMKKFTMGVVLYNYFPITTSTLVLILITYFIANGIFSRFPFMRWELQYPYNSTISEEQPLYNIMIEEGHTSNGKTRKEECIAYLKWAFNSNEENSKNLFEDSSELSKSLGNEKVQVTIRPFTNAIEVAVEIALALFNKCNIKEGDYRLYAYLLLKNTYNSEKVLSVYSVWTTFKNEMKSIRDSKALLCGIGYEVNKKLGKKVITWYELGPPSLDMF